MVTNKFLAILEQLLYKLLLSFLARSWSIFKYDSYHASHAHSFFTIHFHNITDGKSFKLKSSTRIPILFYVK